MTQSDELRAKLNGETARIAWAELARFHARGSVLAVSPTVDLVEVAVALAEDDTDRVRDWLAAGEVTAVSDHQAGLWHARKEVMWAVVVAPWVVVQPEPSGDVS